MRWASDAAAHWRTNAALAAPLRRLPLPLPHPLVAAQRQPFNAASSLFLPLM